MSLVPARTPTDKQMISLLGMNFVSSNRKPDKLWLKQDRVIFFFSHNEKSRESRLVRPIFLLILRVYLHKNRVEWGSIQSRWWALQGALHTDFYSQKGAGTRKLH